MARIAIYPGSFDPVTRGHVDVIERGAALFDELVVAVGNNPAKRYRFDLAQRRELISLSVSAPNVRVVPFEGLIVAAAKVLGASVILRGLRGPADLDLELRNGLANRDLSGIETLFLLSDPAFAHVSSSLVKEISALGGDVARYVPPAVQAALVAPR